MDMITLALANGEIDKLKKSGGVGYIEKTETSVLPETVLTVSDTPPLIWTGFYPTLGQTYIICLDGTEYTCTAVDAGAYDDGMSGVIWVGNPAATGEENPPYDTGEPFFMQYQNDSNATYPQGALLIYMVNGEFQPTCTLKITQATETIHPIDPKFLPGVCLPVMELSQNIPVDGTATALTTEEAAAMDTIAATGLPMVVKFHDNAQNTIAAQLSLACISDGAESVYMYAGQLPFETFFRVEVVRVDGTWGIIVSPME